MLVDCLTLWLANLMGAGRDVDAETAALDRARLPRAAARSCWSATRSASASCRTTPLGRAFRDDAGRLNQAVAGAADRVVFVAAGLPLVLKDTAKGA